LPKGGGAIRGIDEKLSVSQPTGTASLTVGVFTSPARQGFGPELALGYDSGAGNGPFGLGWSLGVPAITRKTSKGLPRYQDASDGDVFILSGAEDLVPLLAVEDQVPPPADTADPWPSADTDAPWTPAVSTRTIGTSTYLVQGYRPRVEVGFARIERWQNTESGDVHWRTISRQNVTSLYGQGHGSRIVDPDDPTRIFSWLLDFSFDDRGNAISYVYKAEDDRNVPDVASEASRTRTANRYLKQVRYGNDRPYDGTVPDQWCFELVLDYGEHDLAEPTPAEQATWPARPDPFSAYRSGFEIRTHRTCRRLLMFHRLAELGHDPVLVRSTDRTYRAVDTPGDPALPPLSLLASVTQTGWVPASGGGYQTKQLPAAAPGDHAAGIAVHLPGQRQPARASRYPAHAAGQPRYASQPEARHALRHEDAVRCHARPVLPDNRSAAMVAVNCAVRPGHRPGFRRRLPPASSSTRSLSSGCVGLMGRGARGTSSGLVPRRRRSP
jgi:hypothetical protein